MEWQDEGIILGARKHGETSAILEVMTRAHGRHLGLVRGGRSRKQQPVLQPGNRVSLTWRARLDEHLGVFQAEPLAFNAARLLDSAVAIHGLLTLAGAFAPAARARSAHRTLRYARHRHRESRRSALRPPSLSCASSFWCSTSSASGST